MAGIEGVRVLFVSGFGPIVQNPVSTRKLYGQDLAITLKEEDDGYLHTEELKGANIFGLWPLSAAAQSCFGSNTWPSDVPAPHAWLEFDVEDVETATKQLESLGNHMLVRNRTEPWGQVVSRFLDPEGLLIGIAYTPDLRQRE